jgi:hypothetical protein
MATSILNTRPARRGKGSRGRGPSVREVCLLGEAPAWTPGARIEWAGRSYLVTATQDGPGRDVPRYVHLSASAAGH